MMVKITQNNDQLLISVNNEERGSLHSLIELLTENDRGTVKGNTIEITTKNHIYPLHQMLTSINNICAKENIDVTFDSESEKVLVNSCFISSMWLGSYVDSFIFMFVSES